MDATKILVVVPFYNCESQILRVIESLLPHKALIHKILFIDNVSIDNGLYSAIQRLKEIEFFPCQVEVVKNNQNYSLGGSHKIGFKYALDNNYDYVVVLHGDDQANFNDIVPYIESRKYTNFDLLLGSRFMNGSVRIGYSIGRTIGNYVFLFLFTLCAKKMVLDMGSGLNMYSRKMIGRDITGTCSDNLVFHCYYLLSSLRSNPFVKFFPIQWVEYDQVSNAKLFKQSVEILLLLCLYIFKRQDLLKTNRSLESYTYDTYYKS